jgi:hypothetical protein
MTSKNRFIATGFVAVGSLIAANGAGASVELSRQLSESESHAAFLASGVEGTWVEIVDGLYEAQTERGIVRIYRDGALPLFAAELRNEARLANTGAATAKGSSHGLIEMLAAVESSLALSTTVLGQQSKATQEMSEINSAGCHLLGKTDAQFVVTDIGLDHYDLTATTTGLLYRNPIGPGPTLSSLSSGIWIAAEVDNEWTQNQSGLNPTGPVSVSDSGGTAFYPGQSGPDLDAYAYFETSCTIVGGGSDSGAFGLQWKNTAAGVLAGTSPTRYGW